jgi:hypothetical protein
MPTPRTVAKYHDFLVYVYIHAPDGFPKEDYLQPHEQMNLNRAFLRLLDHLPDVSSRIKEPRKLLVLRELLVLAKEAYEENNDVRGAQILQEFEGMVWPQHKQSTSFFEEASQRIASS